MSSKDSTCRTSDWNKRQAIRAIGREVVQVEGLGPDESPSDEPDPRPASRSARQKGPRKERRYGSGDGSPDVRLNSTGHSAGPRGGCDLERRRNLSVIASLEASFLVKRHRQW